MFVGAFGEHSLHPQGNRMIVEMSSTVGSSLSKGAVNLTVTKATVLTLRSSERPSSFGVLEP